MFSKAFFGDCSRNILQITITLLKIEYFRYFNAIEQNPIINGHEETLWW